MTQRRGHWTDDLINAVSDLIYTDYSGDDLVYAILTIIEDWQAATPHPDQHSAAADYWRLQTCLRLDAEAAIQAVREIEPVFPADDAPPWVHAEARGWNTALAEVFRILDSGA